jgi:arylmalonate decarboxylase
MSDFPPHSIGWVYAGAMDRTAEEFYAMTPNDVDLVIYTRLWSLKMMHDGPFDKDAFDSAEVVSSAKDLCRYRKVDSLFISGDLIQFAMGPAWVEEMRQEVESATGLPTTTAVSAACDAFRHLGVTKIAVGTPWRPEKNEYVASYFTEAGFEIAGIDGFMTTSPEDAMRLDRATSFSKPLEVFEKAADAEAIYIACPLWRGAGEAIEPLEQKTGVPVLSFYSPVIWRCLDSMGLRRSIPGFGRLLAG